MAMRTIAKICLALFALAVLPCSASAQRRPARATHDWTAVAVRTPEGGFRLGNPAAPVKLVEYLSTTCPHCAALARESRPTIMGQIRSGRLSLEYRNYVLNGYDMAASALSRCAAPRAYFAMTEELLATQDAWMGRINALTEAQRTALRGLSPLQAVQQLVHLLALDAIAARHGIAPPVQSACVNQAALEQLAAMERAAEHDFQVDATPTFLLNGRSIGTQSWATLEPRLRGN